MIHSPAASEDLVRLLRPSELRSAPPPLVWTVVKIWDQNLKEVNIKDLVPRANPASFKSPSVRRR